MATTKEDIAYWTKRAAELERELDAATKLSDTKAIAGELHRTRAALKKVGSAVQHPKRAWSRQSARRTASNEAGPASSSE